MSRSEWFTVGVTAVAIAAGFFLGGPVCGFVFLAIAIVAFFFWNRAGKEEQREHDLGGLFGGLVPDAVPDAAVATEDDKAKPANENAVEPEPDASQQADALSSLPVYRQDVQLEALSICQGHRPSIWNHYIFLHIRIVALTDASVLAASFAVKTLESTYDAKPVDTITDWYIRRESTSNSHPFTTVTREDIGPSMSLWERGSPLQLQQGIHREGWAAFVVNPPQPEADMLARIIKMALVLRDGNGHEYKFAFLPPFTGRDGEDVMHSSL